MPRPLTGTGSRLPGPRVEIRAESPSGAGAPTAAGAGAPRDRAVHLRRRPAAPPGARRDG